jgi:hypothetical protein
MLMTEAELTAENKSARERSQRCIAAKGTQEPTKIKAVLRSPLCFVMYSVSYSGVSRLYMAWKSSLGSSFLIDWKYLCARPLGCLVGSVRRLKLILRVPRRTTEGQR